MAICGGGETEDMDEDVEEEDEEERVDLPRTLGIARRTERAAAEIRRCLVVLALALVSKGMVEIADVGLWSLRGDVDIG